MPEAVSSAAPTAPAAPAAGGAPPAARNNAGQFSPKDGATGVTPVAKPAAGAPQPPAEPKKPEPWKVKLKLDNEDVELDEQRYTQEAKELRWRRKQQNEVAAMKREAEELVRLAQTDEDAFFKKLGVDVDARAERKLAERLRLSQMTPEQQDLERARAELDAGKKEVDAEKKRIADAQRQQQRHAAQARNRQEYEQALGHSMLPHSRAKLFMMTQIQRGHVESGAPRMNPEQLGKAFDEMMFSAFDEVVRSATTKPETLGRWPDLPKLAMASLEKLDGPALLQLLGPGIQRKVLEASLAAHRGQQTIPVKPAGGQPPPAKPQQQAGGSIDEVQLEQRKRDFLKGYGS
jgi:hypothetical protein